ncbi:glycosyltransferase [Roseivivax sp. GX 12232]|uniref:glycosyltransferase n=1 Tax=Roseivivax sp. GX 12232 TaxID=2900547 RepID=UPI001E61CDC6|nr:glycosyltransferase [Roseivivax sp. GX 12232]MCE0506020.1 glycosyltransferase [Roseivivax sp. GX 12232]
MKILCIHQNFPGQYKHLAPALVARGHEVRALTLRVKERTTWKGVDVLPYKVEGRSTKGVFPLAADFETKLMRATYCYRAALALRDQGFSPDVILAHHGWGESLFLKDVWPEARLGLYCELYYSSDPAITAFDPEFAPKNMADQPLKLRLKNFNNRMHEEIMDSGLSPTRFQADTFPEVFQDRLSVIHDGIDTEAVRPNPEAWLDLDEGRALTRADEVVTFINRNLEPHRGYHVFMRMLPSLLKARPEAQVVLLGGDGVSYGSRSASGKSWKEIFIEEVRDRIPEADWARVHFLGRVSYERFLSVIQVSRVHVYLTYPFVLSWSLLEAMSAGAAVVASDVAPVREVLDHDVTGRLVDFFDQEALLTEVTALLEDGDARARLGAAARAHVVGHYDLRRVCLPQHLAWVEQLAKKKGRLPKD